MQPFWKTRIKDILNARSITFLFGFMVLKVHVKYLCADLLVDTNSFTTMFYICTAGPYYQFQLATKFSYAVTRGIRNPCPSCPGIKVLFLNCKEMVVTCCILIVLMEASLKSVLILVSIYSISWSSKWKVEKNLFNPEYFNSVSVRFACIMAGDCQITQVQYKHQASSYYIVCWKVFIIFLC